MLKRSIDCLPLSPPSPRSKTSKSEEEGNDELVCYWDYLSLEIQYKILSYLPLTNAYNLCLVCNQWRYVYFNSCKSLNLIPFTRNVTNTVLEKMISMCPLINKLSVGKVGESLPLNEEGINSLGKFSELRFLNLISCTFSKENIIHLGQQLRKLKVLNVTWCSSLNDESLSGLSLFTSLTHISFQESRITDIGMKFISFVPWIKSLNISFCNLVSDVGIGHICINLHALESLNLSWCVRITDTALKYISHNLFQLKILYLTGCKSITIDGKDYICKYCSDCKVHADSTFMPYKRVYNIAL
eukprot:TRINITY_DN8793_c0_g1_i1.p1 TRINITY_DN8793_c0_g1~~TRINITY_DN8793_c0_g1_i1.p1  ORF type:complete len:328 (-),score=29.85 TRINITY_DN8793_c0_g1_i1:324-1223(-)